MKDLHADKPPNDEVLARLLKLAGPRPEPTAAAREAVYKEVHDVWQARVRRGSVIRRLVPVAVAASAIGVALVFWPQSPQIPVFAGPVGHFDRGGLEFESDGLWHAAKPGETLTGDMHVRTGNQVRAGIILSNGISLRLDHGVQLRLKTPRLLALHQGRIYVDTVGHRGQSIEVVTAGGVVRDIGTQFEVQVDASHTVVRVRDGEVMLDTAFEDFHAGRGESLLMSADGQVERSAVASYDDSWDWMHDIAPYFDTDGRQVSELIAWVGRETGREIRYADDRTRNTAASTRIRGSLSGHTPEETLDLALATTRFKYHINDTVLAIEKHN
ncbi:MAG: FecR family protein [Gammaproteobacteria bacterium]|nr:FecR family protein [Gammaproteobacteria bacterium]MDH3767860.1 FecR family protein [Gammaproteobacteria bacterium]